MKLTVSHLIQTIADNFTHIYEHRDEQEQAAWWLLQAITKKSEAQLLAQQTIELSKDEEYQLQKAINDHKKNLKPLQYIIGWVPFLDSHIFVEPPILIPRPETEEWCDNLIKQLQQLPDKNIYILDLATGSGCIAIALAKALPQARILATDISEQAVALARKNAKYNGAHPIEFLKSDLYTSIPHSYTFDLIVSNPPYIAPDEWENLSPMVKKWEDQKALAAPDSGYAIIQEIIQHAAAYLKKNSVCKQANIPQLVLEIGYNQGPTVKKYMQEAGFVEVTIHKDLEGKDRLVTGGL
ncbi:MAG: peptide chain release factor N(5)-glutamine methyltransferase [Candidatus Babeliales bacterium]